MVVHPADADRLGLADGDEVIGRCRPMGSWSCAVKVSDEVVPGVAFAPLNLSDAPLSVLFAERMTLPRVRIVK